MIRYFSVSHCRNLILLGNTDIPFIYGEPSDNWNQSYKEIFIYLVSTLKTNLIRYICIDKN